MRRVTDLTELLEGVSTTFHYDSDPAGRLTPVRRNGVLVATYEYDLNENRLHLTTPNGVLDGVFDAQDQLTSFDPNSYTYTPNGELLTKTDASGTTTYTYDFFGGLIKAELPGNTVIA